MGKIRNSSGIRLCRLLFKAVKERESRSNSLDRNVLCTITDNCSLGDSILRISVPEKTSSTIVRLSSSGSQKS